MVGDSFGSSVSSAGDFNNDGYDDLIIGAPDYFRLGNGNAYVIFGKSGTNFSNIDLASTSLSSSSKGFQVLLDNIDYIN